MLVFIVQKEPYFWDASDRRLFSFHFVVVWILVNLLCLFCSVLAALYVSWQWVLHSSVMGRERRKRSSSFCTAKGTVFHLRQKEHALKPNISWYCSITSTFFRHVQTKPLGTCSTLHKRAVNNLALVYARPT